MSVLELGVAAGAGYEAYEAEEEGLFTTQTPAGWALILAVLGFVTVALILGRGRGLMRGAGAALGFGLLIAGTEAWVHFLARSYALANSDSPLAGGVGIDL